jgi:asparagine synthase (glutamine-hydrolysing)
VCGISALVATGQEPPGETIERMVASLGHRGPDARACKILSGCHLGHTRLSIIDLESGAQPMADPHERYWITFNGEIYNYRELRRELMEQGHRFQTHSDTEVILAAYAQWGAKCLDRFRGMFAFAIWDTQERQLFAARDLFGEKPLYYAIIADGSLLAASEIKGLLASKLLEPRLDLSAIDAYLALGYIPPDQTVYQNIHTLPPGHYLEQKNGCLRVCRYWAPQFNNDSISLDEAGERLRELLAQAVRRQMVADVPVGAFLSGGLDSSTIVALMQGQSGQPVKTFSVGFGDFINELPYARAVADLYKTDHHEIDLGFPPVAEMLERMATVYEEPFADSSNIPTYLIAEFARRQVKVVLSGDGGDELFGGYAWYLPLAMSENLPASWFKWVVLRTVSKLLRHQAQGLNLFSGALGLAARWPDMWTRDLMSNIQFKAKDRHRSWGERSWEVNSFLPGEYFLPPAETSGLNRGFYFDLTSYLPGDILVKVDRAAMAHGLETRAPFLDRDLVEFALSLPPSLKVNGDQTKVVLRDACSRYWPPPLLSRHKLGFGAPCGVWLGLPKVQALTARVFADRAPLRRLLPGLRRDQARKRTFQTWILLTLGLWLEQQGVAV